VQNRVLVVKPQRGWATEIRLWHWWITRSCCGRVTPCRIFETGRVPYWLPVGKVCRLLTSKREQLLVVSTTCWKPAPMM